MMLKVSLKVVFVYTLILFAACSNGARQQNSSEYISPALAETWATWQEAYAALLRDYASQCPYAEYYWADWGWHFAVHNMDEGDIPKLFIIMLHSSGHASYSTIYTFVNGKLVTLEFQGITTDGGVFAPLNNDTFIVHAHPIGFGNFYRRLELDGLALVETALGRTELNEAGLERMFGNGEEEDHNWHHSYEWFNLYTIVNIAGDRHLVTVQEFESIFLRRDERKWLEILSITNENVEQSIFGRY